MASKKSRKTGQPIPEPAKPVKTKWKIRWKPILAIAILLAGMGGMVFWHLQSRKAAASTFTHIVAERRIVDVHEHIQSMNQVPIMLGAMDAVGIGKVALMGSSWFTMTLNPSVGFTRYDEINEELIKIVEKYPDRFEAWPTINPKDPEKLKKFQDLVQRGAKGLKLYIGHGFVIKKTNTYMFHTLAMDDPEMLPVYQYCQENFIPVCLHVNPSPKTPGFAEEFVAVLNQFPDLKVICPHWMLSSIMESRLEELLDTYPNLYTDVSFGHDDFMIPGLRRISKPGTAKKPDPDRYRRLFTKYPTRFMFSTDIVLNDEPAKDVKWVSERFQTYIDMLTQDSYTTPLIPKEQLRGLALSSSQLERVFYKNHEDFMALKPKGTKIKHQLNWQRMGVTPQERRPGMAFPPPLL